MREAWTWGVEGISPPDYCSSVLQLYGPMF